MRAMILAAGEGRRMGALTRVKPKPLLMVAGRYLIEYAITSLSRAGIHDIVINVSYNREQMIKALGNGSRWGVNIVYSEECERLETGGGIVKALPLLGTEPFIVISADVITDYPLQRLPLSSLRLAHLVVVKNPSYHPEGDYCLNENNEIYIGSNNAFTFANVGIYRPELFAGHQPTYLRLAHLWRNALIQGQLTGEYYDGFWYNVGTPQELQAAEEALKALPLIVG